MVAWSPGWAPAPSKRKKASHHRQRKERRQKEPRPEPGQLTLAQFRAWARSTWSEGAP